MSADLSFRYPARPQPAVTLVAALGLARGRVHEASGPARQSFAVLVAAAMAGPVLWIAPLWQEALLHPDGVARFFDPARLLLIRPQRAPDLLWAMEEALRSGAAPLVVAELGEPPGLTPVRRLLLAAESSGTAPLGLLLTPGEGGANGVESRWHMAPRYQAGITGWRLERRRARAQKPQAWHLSHREGRLRIDG